jgi:hypothetical protein
LGENRPIDIQGVSGRSPKPFAIFKKPELIVDFGDLPATARELRDLLASTGNLFDRGTPVKVVQPADGSLPRVRPLSITNVVIEAHRVCRPVRLQGEDALKLDNPPGDWRAGKNKKGITAFAVHLYKGIT